MRKNLLQYKLCVLLIMCWTMSAWAQKIPPHYKCGHLPMHKKLMQRANPLLKQQIENARQILEKQTTEYTTLSARQSSASQSVLTIPIVFHVVHDGGVENISDAQIIESVKQLNEDFSATNPGVGDVVNEFKPLVADVGLKFVLAQKDPNGNPTTGITRTRSSITYNGGNLDLKRLIRWPRNMYLNVWVVRSSDGGNGSGFAFYPSGTVGSNAVYDGVVVSHWAVGRTGTAAATHYKLLTHEVGHWANLKHIWGGDSSNSDDSACNDDDDVSDTPNTKGTTGCELTATSCGSLDNNQNYMDYGTCSEMFTEGQKTRMLAAMNSSVGERNNLWTQANLDATLYSSATPRVVFAKTTFSESKTNDGGIDETIELNLLDGATFNVASGELDASAYSITGLPTGFSAKITIANNTTAELVLQGSTDLHAKANSVDDISLSFNASAFGVVVSNLTTSGIGIDFINPYTIVYEDINDLQVTTSAVWTSFNMGFGNATYGIFYNAEKASFQLESYGKSAVCEAGTRNIVPLPFNTVIGSVSQWEAGGNYPDLLDVTNATHTAWNGKTAYVGVRFSNAGSIHYGWLKLEVAADGQSYKLLEYAYHEQPDAAIRAGQSMLDVGNLSVSKTTVKEDAFANDGSVNETIILSLLNGEEFNQSTGDLTASTHFSVANLPAGLSAKIKVLTTTTAELSFTGKATSHDEVHKVNNVQIALKAAAVSGNNDLPLPVLSIFFMDAYQIIYRDVTPDLEVTTVNVWNFFRMDVGNAEYGVFYNAEQSAFQLESYGKSAVCEAGTRNMVPLPLNTVIGENSQWEAGGAFPDLLNVNSPTYTAWNGKTAYVGIRFNANGNTHYGWLKLEVAADGQSYKLLEHAYNEQPEAPIKAGQTEVDDEVEPETPVAAFSADPTTIFVGQSVQFTDESTNSPTNWIWIFEGGDITTSNGERNPLVSYSKTGTFSVTLTVSNAEGTNTLTKTAYITVIDPPAPIAAFTANTTNIQAGDTVTFTDESLNNPTSWAWTFEGGTPATSTEQNPTVTYDQPGFYTVTLTVGNSGGASIIIKKEYIIVRPACDYCDFASSRADFEYIAGVKMGNMTHTSGAAEYSDFRENMATVFAGQDNAIELTPGFAGTEYSEYFSVWIDYNGDCDFDDAGELVYTSEGTMNTVTGMIAIPADLQGMTTMRVAMRFSDVATRPCGNFADGEVEDYTIHIVPGDGDNDDDDDDNDNDNDYCDAGADNLGSEHIAQVQLSNIDNSSTSSGYANYTSEVANVSVGQTHNLTVTPSASWEDSKLSVWVDWNQDGDFNDSNEANVVTGVGPYSIELDVPAGAKLGETRMRIRLSYANSMNEPCGNSWTGEVEDYTLKVQKAGTSSQEAEAGKPKLVLEASAYPNPSPNGQYTVEVPANGQAQQMNIRVFSLQGNLVTSKTAEGNRTTLSLQGLGKGLYHMQVVSGGKVYNKKLIYR
ncbi:GEVED domain-containing protein [Microscilla marina]|uniref:Collagenase, putative n=1 Tax=Microscilla marina ATCC 23134 TaxID=313606 RepID=A1ZKY5_MICM2|nr:GEVED domain-containing protein [Microscilla marina]EAY28951.1 collagenase, putative [Microscilla marina ATCC 23134]